MFFLQLSTQDRRPTIGFTAPNVGKACNRRHELNTLIVRWEKVHNLESSRSLLGAYVEVLYCGTARHHVDCIRFDWRHRVRRKKLQMHGGSIVSSALIPCGCTNTIGNKRDRQFTREGEKSGQDKISFN